MFSHSTDKETEAPRVKGTTQGHTVAKTLWKLQTSICSSPSSMEDGIEATKQMTHVYIHMWPRQNEGWEVADGLGGW